MIRTPGRIDRAAAARWTLRDHDGPEERRLLEDIAGRHLPKNVAAARADPQQILRAVGGAYDRCRRIAGVRAVLVHRCRGQRAIHVPHGRIAGWIAPEQTGLAVTADSDARGRPSLERAEDGGAVEAAVGIELPQRGLAVAVVPQELQSPVAAGRKLERGPAADGTEDRPCCDGEG